VFLRVLEYAAFALMFAFMLTQVIYPIWAGSILFPFFRSKTNELTREIAVAKDEDAVADLELEVKTISTRTRTKRKTKVV
jgi:hypothetical protein